MRRLLAIVKVSPIGVVVAVVAYGVGHASITVSTLIGVLTIWLYNVELIVAANRFLFEINDAELVRVSKLANEAEDALSEIKEKLSQAENSIDLLRSEMNWMAQK